MNAVRNSAWICAWLACLVAGLPAAGQERPEPFCARESLTVPEGETREGDTYFFAQNVTISGVWDGDLIGGHQASVINGVVTGDVASFGSSLDIRGEVRDSVRFFGQSINVTGIIDGDLLAFAAQVNVHPEARITGSVHLFAASAFVDGSVGRDVTFKGGHVSIGGPVDGEVRLTADRVHVRPEARVAGDFRYKSRKPIELPEGTVAGDVVFEELVKDRENDADDEGAGWSAVLKWIWWTLAALLVGSVAVALLRRATVRVIEPIGREGIPVLLIGLGIFLVVPAAALLAMALVIPLPLGLIALVLFFVGLYLAKLPVAIWLGAWLLERFGVEAPSPFAALALGVVILYAVYELPFFIGTLSYLVTAWLGLGALAIGLRDHLRSPTPAA